MNYALITDNTPQALTGSSITSGDVQFSYATMLLWTDAERAALDIYPITDDAIPDGKVATGSSLAFADGVVTRHWTLEDAPPPPVPASISDRQFFQQLAVDSIITQDEALASNAAVIPAALLAIISAMSADQQFSAKMLISGATVFERDNAMTIAIGTAYGWNADQIDGFFREAAQL